MLDLGDFPLVVSYLVLNPGPFLNHVVLAYHSSCRYNYKNSPRSRIKVRPTPTALLRYHADKRWILSFDLDL